ncbi:MAG: T9SS type A sorting domain-containing protein [Bacteroidia bacterium]
MRIIGFFLFVFVVLTACNESTKKDKHDPILSYFTEALNDRPINFAKRVGGELMIESEAGKQSYILDYDNTDKTTNITNELGDVVYSGLVYRYRGTYYMSTILPDSVFLFNAFEINGEEIKGFLEFEKQMRSLDDTLSYYIKNPLERPSYLTKCSAEGIGIITDKKLVKALFEPILEKATVKNILDNSESELETDTAASAEDEPIDIIVEGLEASLSPNPVTDKATITFPGKSKYKFFITDMGGQVKFDDRCKCESFEMNTSELESGSYLLTIIDLKSKEKQVVKFVK